MTFGQRFSEFRKFTKTTQTELAELIECNQSDIHAYEHNKYRPSYETLEIIYKKFNVDLIWMITGENQMFLQDSKRSIDHYKNMKVNEIEQKLTSFINEIKSSDLLTDNHFWQVNIVSFANADGIDYLAEGELITTIPVSKTILPSKDGIYGFLAPDDSMTPDIKEGDYVMINKNFNLNNLHDKIVAVGTNDGVSLKRFVIDKQSSAQFLCSLNPIYMPFPYRDDTKILGTLKLIIRVIE